MDIEQYKKRKPNLEAIEVFEHFTLYYDREDHSLWVWNGYTFYGIDAVDLYNQLND